MNAASRREFLHRATSGLGGIALTAMLADDARAKGTNPLAARKPHFAAEGEARHLPVHGRRAEPDRPVRSEAGAGEVGRQAAAREPPADPKASSPPATNSSCPARGSSKKHGQSGIEMSDLMPNLATCVDDICFLRSCWCTNTVHAPAMYELHSGRTLMGFPSLGSLGDLRSRQRQREPAGVLRDAATGGRAGRRGAVLVERVLAGDLPGHAVAQRAEPDPEPEAAGGREPPSRTAARSTSSGS